MSQQTATMTSPALPLPTRHPSEVEPSSASVQTTSTRSPSPTLPAQTEPAAPNQKKRVLAFAPDPRPWPTRNLAYQWRPFRGMWDDLKRRAPYYWTDYTEGFQPRNLERVVGATIRMYFLSALILASPDTVRH